MLYSSFLSRFDPESSLTEMKPAVVLIASTLVRSRLSISRVGTVRCLHDEVDGGNSVSGVVYTAPVGSPTVQLFTKAGCTLCDVAKGVLKTASTEQPHTLETVDITDADKADWWQKYKYDIPVLHVNGAYWAKHR